jgi:hypothetical protein
MPAVTVQELIDRAKAAADMHDDFVTDAQWILWANIENQKLWSFVARCGYVIREDREDIPATGATQYTFNEPAAILGVYELVGSRYRRIRHSDAQDGAGYINTGTNGQATMFRVFQNTNGQVSLQLWPVPTSGEYKVYVIPQADTLDATSDSVNYPMGWEEYIVLGMAKRALAKEETRNPMVDAEHDDISRHIESTAWERLFGAHKSIRNVDRVERGWSNYPDHYGDPASWLWI